MNRAKVVVTGAAGMIGQVLWHPLGERWDLLGVDIRPVGTASIVVADVTDLDALLPLVEGARAILHLATASGTRTRWEDVGGPNVAGFRTVLESARLAGVPRCILASSNHVTGQYEKDSPYRELLTGTTDGSMMAEVPLITHRSPIRPDSLYATSKACGEAIGRYYSDSFGMEVVCIRLGTVNPEDRPLKVRHLATLLTHRDLTSLVRACLEVGPIPFAIVYGVSANRRRIWDLEHAREVLGWSPRDNAEDMWISPGGP